MSKRKKAKAKHRKTKLKKKASKLTQANPVEVKGKTTRTKRPITEIDKTLLVPSAKDVEAAPWRRVSDKKVAFSEAVAVRHAELPDVAWERPISQDWVDKLAREMASGRFIVEKAELASCVCEGLEYRINGQHTAYARFMYLPRDWKPMIRIVRYEVDDMDGLRELYSKQDRERPRTTKNVVTARLFESQDFMGISKGRLGRIASGLRFLQVPKEADRKHVAIDEIITDLQEKYTDQCQHIENIIGKGAEAKHMDRSSVMAAIFCTLDKSVSGSKQFWGDVREGVGLTKRSPQLKLRDWLQSSTVSRGRGAGRLRTVTSEAMFRACIFAWNAWRANRELALIKALDDGKRPKVRR